MTTELLIDRLLVDLGGTVAVARKLELAAPSVTNWKKRGVPPERRPDLELHYYPRFEVEQIKDGARWVRVPDPSWPHPGGRPCLDVAAQ